MASKASVMRESPLVPENAIACVAAASCPWITGMADDTLREKSIKLRSVIPNGVGSTDAAWLPNAANGTVPVTLAPFCGRRKKNGNDGFRPRVAAAVIHEIAPR